MTRPFRFAVQAYSASSAGEWRALARKVEDLGYSALHLADHYIGPGPALASTNHPVQTLAAVPAMAVAAAATTTLRVGCRVLCVDYHHPVVLAKELATLDLLSDGRIEAGLGAGWLAAEYDAMGIPMAGAGQRIDKLAATVDLLRACFAGGEVKIDEAGVLARDFSAVPVPVRPGGPPIMIGGGSRRVLTLAGAKADIVSLNFDNSPGVLGAASIASGAGDRTAEKVAWVRDGAGDRFDKLELEIGAYFTAVTDPAGAGDAAERLGGSLGIAAGEVATHPHVLVGSVEMICDELERRRAAYGISYVTVGASVIDAFGPVAQRLTGR